MLELKFNMLLCAHLNVHAFFIVLFISPTPPLGQPQSAIKGGSERRNCSTHRINTENTVGTSSVWAGRDGQSMEVCATQ